MRVEDIKKDTLYVGHDGSVRRVVAIDGFGKAAVVVYDNGSRLHIGQFALWARRVA